MVFGYYKHVASLLALWMLGAAAIAQPDLPSEAQSPVKFKLLQDLSIGLGVGIPVGDDLRRAYNAGWLGQVGLSLAVGQSRWLAEPMLTVSVYQNQPEANFYDNLWLLKMGVQLRLPAELGIKMWDEQLQAYPLGGVGFFAGWNFLSIHDPTGSRSAMDVMFMQGLFARLGLGASTKRFRFDVFGEYAAAGFEFSDAFIAAAQAHNLGYKLSQRQRALNLHQVAVLVSYKFDLSRKR